MSTLRNTVERFDEAYVQAVYEAYCIPKFCIPQPLFEQITRPRGEEGLCYLPTYAMAIGGGLGYLLLTLHASGAITLPFGFDWPSNSRGSDPTAYLEFPLLKFLRSVGMPGEENDPAFEFILTDARRRNLFVSYGVKLLLATGWKSPVDATIDIFIKLKDASIKERFVEQPARLPFKQLVVVMSAKFGAGFKISSIEWRQRMLKAVDDRRISNQQSDIQNIDDVISMLPSDARPDRIAKLSRLPGLDLDLKALSSEWIKLELLHIAKRRAESDRARLRSLGYLNLYLFFYLPFWFAEKNRTPLCYPKTPRELIATIFVSRLVPQPFDTPVTLVEFLERFGDKQKWETSKYSILKDLEAFFDFLVLISDEVVSCKGFRQPLAKHDFPIIRRPRGTNKRPIPRRLFKFYIAYIDALRALNEVILEKTLTGEITQWRLSHYFNNRHHTLDTFRLAGITGFIPGVLLDGRYIPLRHIPNCVDIEHFRLKDGRSLRIPQPHGLNHVLVALYTGIRNNHVQWLDAGTFDIESSITDKTFTKLLVNTDKVRTSEWTPHVNVRVMEVLRSQLAWRKLIGDARFSEKILYMGRAKTKWPPILPLFSCLPTGAPHPDSRYEDTWNELLLGVQSMLREVGMEDAGLLCELLPSGASFNDEDRAEALLLHANSHERVIPLSIKSDITPHSARVGVVSRLIHVLPADVIGEYVTGQTPGMVYHYVVLEPGELEAISAHQRLALAQEGTGSPGRVSQAPNPRFVKADEINSNLRRALRSNLDATLASYGCVSLTLAEGGKAGIDVLRETRGISAGFSKTEICPFGHHCPPDVMKELRGSGRCSMCWYAVRSIDHLPAVVAKTRQTVELLSALEAKLEGKNRDRYTEAEQEQLEAERQRLAEEAIAWHLSGEVLESQRMRIVEGADSRTWVVPRPEVVDKRLRRLSIPSTETAYVLARLAESVAYPTFDSPEIVARFDLLRRQLLANIGDIRYALTSHTPADLSSECIGLLKAVAASHSMTSEEVLHALNADGQLPQIANSVVPRILPAST